MTRPKPRRPRADVVAHRFKRGTSLEVMAWEVYRANFAKVHGVSMSECIELVEDALRRSMNRGRRA